MIIPHDCVERRRIARSNDLTLENLNRNETEGGGGEKREEMKKKFR